ncbi:MAG: mannitol dehydrogenase family protein [Sphaerochaetaceae bacterium]|jgi:fructuronate reductase|nr:mannitol dehydrogenase family protein [Sphaerochaetaceae bacterium]
MKLELKSLKDKAWVDKGYAMPRFDIKRMRKNTASACRWVHFGSGNIFRAFLAAKAQELLESGDLDSGIVVGEGFDAQMIDKAYDKFDNLSIDVTLKGNGTVDKTVVASVAEAYVCNPANDKWARFCGIFQNPALQMVSFTITEKGYATAPDYVQQDILRGPEKCSTIICMVASLLLKRFEAGAYPLAVVSMDNCSRNGEKLGNGVMAVAQRWMELGLVGKAFVDYVENPAKISFPWTMIDKITPRPDASVAKMLSDDGVEDMDIVVTDRKTWIAGFVNSEECEYLVVEDKFPNGRPRLEKAGVYFTDRETVTKVERMKVCTCLNPLHTAMSVAGCLLGYTKISDEMRDPDIVSYIKTLGYVEGLPVVTDPGILSPRSFIDDVVYKRLPNPFMPDTPQRIATDTSQKLAIRFGETVKAYQANGLDMSKLECLPLALASWMRYLLAIDDSGKAFEPSPDPLLASAQEDMASVKFGSKVSASQLEKIMRRSEIWGYDLYESSLKDKVVADFNMLNAGPGAVRRTLSSIVRK